jgi:hypothetical protein
MNLGAMINNYSQCYSATSKVGLQVAKQHGITNFKVRALILPYSQSQIESLAQGNRQYNYKKLYLAHPQNLNIGDSVSLNNTVFNVIARRDYPQANYSSFTLCGIT